MNIVTRKIDNSIIAKLIDIHNSLELLDTVGQDAELNVRHTVRDCDKSGLNQLDCQDEGKWLIEPSEADRKVFNTFTFSCDQHFDLVRFELASEILRRRLDAEARDRLEGLLDNAR